MGKRFAIIFIPLIIWSLTMINLFLHELKLLDPMPYIGYIHVISALSIVIGSTYIIIKDSRKDKKV